VADLTSALVTKKEYQKRLNAKLLAYKEISFLLRKTGGGENKIQELLR